MKRAKLAAQGGGDERRPTSRSALVAACRCQRAMPRSAAARSAGGGSGHLRPDDDVPLSAGRELELAVAQHRPAPTVAVSLSTGDRSAGHRRRGSAGGPRHWWPRDRRSWNSSTSGRPSRSRALSSSTTGRPPRALPPARTGPAPRRRRARAASAPWASSVASVARIFLASFSSDTFEALEAGDLRHRAAR